MTAFIQTWRGASAIIWWIIASPFQNIHLLMKAKDEDHAQAMLQVRSERLMARARLKVALVGNPPPEDRGYVFCYNETSLADVIAFSAIMWRYIDRAAAAEVFMRIPFARAVGKKAGIEVVERGNRAKNDIVLNRMVAALQSGLSVAWGGEGRLSGFDGVGRFKVGASLIAIRSGKSIIPVCFNGGHKAMPVRSLRAIPRTISLRFGDPIPVVGLTEDDARALTDRVQAAVAALYALD